MSKTYLDGKITLKEPTLEGLCNFGQLLTTYQYSELIAGNGLLELLPIACEFKDGFDFKKSISPGLATEILKDFFTSWNPTKWISANMEVLGQSLKSLRDKPTQRDSKKPSKRE